MIEIPQRPRLVGLAVLLVVILGAVSTEFRGNALGRGLCVLAAIVALLSVIQEYQRWRRS